MGGSTKTKRLCCTNVLRLIIRSWTRRRTRAWCANVNRPCMVRTPQDTIQITDSAIRLVVDTTMNPETPHVLDCTRVPIGISNGTFCDIIHISSEHTVCRIPCSSTTWVFALVVGPSCKSLELQLDMQITSIVPMFIYLACPETRVTIRSRRRHQFDIHYEHMSPRILPHLRFPQCTGTIIVPTSESQMVCASYQLPIRTWKCLLAANETPINRPSITQTITKMYDRLSSTLFENIYTLNTVFDPDAVYKTYNNLHMSMNALRSIISKVRSQANKILQLQEMLKVHGYIVTAVSTLSFDIGEMLKADADIEVTYD